MNNNETIAIAQQEWDAYTYKDVDIMLLLISFSDVCPDISERIKNDKTLKNLKICVDQANKDQEDQHTKVRRLTGRTREEQENIAFNWYCIYQQKKREYDTALFNFIKKLVPNAPIVIAAKVLAYQFKDVKATNPWTSNLK